jgi:transposase-like protein
VAKQREGKEKKYTEEFRRQAVERMKETNNVKALARELGVDRHTLYDWRKRAADLSDRRSANGQRSKQEKENKELKRLLAEKTLEVDFFRGALQKVAARRQPSSANGETASTTKSGK